MVYRLTKRIWEFDSFDDVKNELTEYSESLCVDQPRHIRRQELRNLEMSIFLWQERFNKKEDLKAEYAERQRIKSITPPVDAATFVSVVQTIASCTQRPY